MQNLPMKAAYIILGGIALALGIVGIALPLLPTTPFLLLALFCFAKGSERLHRRFTHSALYRRHLQSFHEKRALPRKTKLSIMALAGSMLAIGFYFTPSLIGRIVIIALILLKLWTFLFWIKTEHE